VQQETVNAALILKLINTNETRELVNGELNVTTDGDRVIHSDHMDELVEQLSSICKHNANGAAHEWVLNIAYEGRCWWIEVNRETPGYSIGYYDVETVDGWNALCEA